MKNNISTADNTASVDILREPARNGRLSGGPDGLHTKQPLRLTLHRYCTSALIIAIALGGLMMLIGLRPMGKGLILGAIFSVLNFILMATALPIRIGLGRGKAFVFSLGSICLRYALLAIPLFLSIHMDPIAVSTVAVGLFMVQIAILGDQLWTRLRNLVKVNC